MFPSLSALTWQQSHWRRIPADDSVESHSDRLPSPWGGWCLMDGLIWPPWKCEYGVLGAVVGSQSGVGTLPLEGRAWIPPVEEQKESLTCTHDVEHWTSCHGRPCLGPDGFMRPVAHRGAWSSIWRSSAASGWPLDVQLTTLHACRDTRGVKAGKNGIPFSHIDGCNVGRSDRWPFGGRSGLCPLASEDWDRTRRCGLLRDILDLVVR